LTDLAGGGAERATLDVLRHLDPERVKATLLLLKRQGVYWKEVPPHVSTECVSGTGRKLRYEIPRLLATLQRLGRNTDVIVGVQELTATYVACAAAVLLRKHMVGWVHTVMDTYLAGLSHSHRVIARLIYPRLSAVVCPSNGAVQSLKRIVLSPKMRCLMIPNPVDGSRLRAMAGEALPEWAPSVLSRPTIVGMGRLEPGKGFDLLIRAHAQMRGRGIEQHLLIMGEGPMRVELESLASALGVRETVHMPGFIGNPYPILKRARAFVLSSRFEGLPVVLLEALALGVPAVATTCPAGPEEVLEGGRCGLLVPVDDADGLAGAIERALTDGDLRAVLSRLGQERAAMYSPKLIATEWEHLLSSLV
jgi:glycosyltransferase involved in cell wall biosynthesis